MTNISKSNSSNVRARLRAGELTAQDKKLIDRLLVDAADGGIGKKIGGKRIIARLPNGMDVIK